MAATKTAPKTGIAGRIERLRALAEHPNTPVHEAEVASYALTRLLARLVEEGESAAYAWAPNWSGGKYQDTHSLGLTEVTKLIRDEIKHRHHQQGRDLPRRAA